MYWMTVRHYSTRGYWVECRARTLRGAKREAWREYGGGYYGHEVVVGVSRAVDQFGNHDIRPVAVRVIGDGGWSDVSGG